MKKQLFTYWEGHCPPLIKYCLQTIREKADVPVVVLDKANVGEYLGNSLNKNYSKISNIAQKVDCIRIGVLYNHGGMWCDADTIILKSMAKLFEAEKDFIGIHWKCNKNVLNGYFWSKAKGNYISACLEDVNRNLEKGLTYYKDPSGIFFGEALFKRISFEKGFKVDRLDQFVMLPVSFPTDSAIWNKPLDIQSFLVPETVAVALNNSHFTAMMRSKMILELAAYKNLLGSLLRLSTGIVPENLIDIPLPAQPIVNPVSCEQIVVEKKISPMFLVEDTWRTMLQNHHLPTDFGIYHRFYKYRSYRMRYEHMLAKLRK
jgi:hypothetical protein